MGNISAEQAIIQTAKIEIKSLTLNGKQMTMSVFRQIHQRKLISEQGGEFSFNGVPWGRVNYHWGSQVTSNLHVLWQDGPDLFRDLIAWGSSATLPYDMKKIALSWRGHQAAGFSIIIEPYFETLLRGYIGQEIFQELSSRIKDHSDFASCDTAGVSEAKARVGKIIEEYILSKFNDERAYTDRWHKFIDPLYALPQLFIAV